MKTTLPIRKTALVLFLFAWNTVSAQVMNLNNAELVFSNSSLYSGTAGNDGAVYLFPSVTTGLDALVTIKGRSSGSVILTNIDLPGNGYAKALQPQVKLNNSGTTNGATSWWMEFEVQFVKAGTTTPQLLSQFKATALDIDGDDDRLREWNSFYQPAAYTTEAITKLSVSNLVVSGKTAGKTFTGTNVNHNGIDTSATDLMATMTYYYTSSVKFRVGAITTGASSNTNRMHSVYFKGFPYASAITLPVKLSSFTAMLSNGAADLRWTTATEINASHFVVERSTDGLNYEQAGLVFAFGNSSDTKSYSFRDNISNIGSDVVYYRLRMVDLDSRSEFSDVRILKLKQASGNVLAVQAYPNPATSELRLTLPVSFQDKPGAIELYTAAGTVLRRIETGRFSQTETLNLATLAPGVYIVRVNCEGQLAQQRVVKQ